MTESAAQSTLHLVPESFWGIFIRRTRYVVAIAISALLFWTLGWRFVAPPAELYGVSLLIWPGNNGLLAAVEITILLMVVATICTLLVHPDSPHMGLFCALAGMMALSMRGGTSHMLIDLAQRANATTHSYALASNMLAVECVQWAILFLIAEMFVRMLHDRFFANIHWLTRTGPGMTEDAITRFATTRAALGVSLAVSQVLKTTTMRRRFASPLAMIASGVIAYLLLYVLLQSELKGQVFFAIFFAFFLSSACAYLAFPRVPAIAILLAVPLTAAVAYFLGRDDPGFYPGYGGAFVTRALPIDFVAAGIPGAILGFYAGIRWSLHSDDSTGP